MQNTSDLIERYLRQLLVTAADSVIELQRGDLAEQFSCVPSQINYVIATRFTPWKGYVVESKRGGGGYIRIRLLDSDYMNRLVHLLQAIGDSIDQKEAEGVLWRLERDEVLTPRESKMIQAALSREALGIPLPERDALRARVMKSMLTAAFAHSREEG